MVGNRTSLRIVTILLWAQVSRGPSISAPPLPRLLENFAETAVFEFSNNSRRQEGESLV